MENDKTFKLPSNMIFRASNDADSSTNNRLILLFGWMGAKAEHLEKYRAFWNSRDYDILTTETSVFDSMFQSRGLRRNFKGFINFFSAKSNAKQYETIVMHSFSIGSFISTHFLNKLIVAAERDPQQLAHQILRSIKGAITDSMAFTDEGASGAAKALTQNPLGQFMVRSGIQLFWLITRPLKLNKGYKLESIRRNNSRRLPGLYLYSRDDELSCPVRTLMLIEKWKSEGLMVREKCWDQSVHVLHYKLHTEEYAHEVDSFMELINLV